MEKCKENTKTKRIWGTNN